MVSIFSKLVNIYARFIGRTLMFLVPLSVIVGLVYFELEKIPETFIWLLDLGWYVFLGNSLILAFNGILVSLTFEGEVRKLTKEGTPIRSAAGFRNLERKYKASNLYLLIILLFAVLAFGFYLLAEYGSEGLEKLFSLTNGSGKTLGVYLAISSVIFTIAASIIIRVPIISGLTVGSLVRYYTPSRHPYVLNSLIRDSTYTLLDPITRVSFTHWSDRISSSIISDFAPRLQPIENRQPLAVQNVLTLIYLHHRFPKIIDKSFLKDELLRIVPEELVEVIIKGDTLNLGDWKDIFNHILNYSPEIFLIIDRILLTLRETPDLIESKDFWIISAVPPTQKKEESQDIVFFILNRKKLDNNPQRVKMSYTGADDLSPHDLDVRFTLRSYDPYITIPRDTSKLLSDDKRLLVKLVTAILYTGTGIWLSAHSENIGTNLIALDFVAEEIPIETQIFNLKVVRDVKYYLQAWGPKILTTFGVLLPILRAVLALF